MSVLTADRPQSLEHTLHGRFLRGLAISPHREAIRADRRGITYTDAHQLALTWAGSLLRACPGPPTAIGILAEKGIEAYIGILAALYCGVPAVPLQPDFPASRIRQAIEAGRVSALVTDERGYRRLPELWGADGMGAPLPVLLPSADRAEGLLPAIDVRPEFALGEPRPVDSAGAAYILFTSGSTGRPKGVPIMHENAAHFFREIEARYDFGPDDVFSQTFDPTFDCAIFDLFAAWGSGGTLVSVPNQAYLAMPEFITAEGITIWYSTPAAISMIARRSGLGPGTLPTLRWSMFAGDALTVADVEAWQRAASGSVVENLYGPTELTITCTAYRWSPESSPGECVNGGVPIGKLHSEHELILLDENGGHSTTEGELCVSGPQLTPGYLDPADNENRFFEHGSRRWYRTGDRARLAESGDLKFLGRIDNQVQVQGWRVELAEIDHNVRGCSGVEDAVTVTTAVDGRLELVVFYTGVPVPPPQFARQLRKALPHQLVPRHYLHLDEMPLNRNRKFDRSALRERASQLLGGRSADHHPNRDEVSR
jgi:amino acid adenylation domain-containing protein